MNIFLISVSSLILVTLSVQSADDVSGFRRADLFLNEPFFLGIPNADTMDVDSFDLDDNFNSGLSNHQLALQGKMNMRGNGDKTSPKVSNWSGRRFKGTLKNSGSDVVKAYKENIESQRQKLDSFDTISAAKAMKADIQRCENICRGLEVLSEEWTCILDCATQNKGALSEVADVLYYGIKTLCHTVNTFYSKFDKLKVKNLETFQHVMKEVEAPTPVSSNVPLRTMFARLITEIFSTMAPFRPVLKKFEEDLSLLEASLNLKSNILLGANPGCSMVDMKKHIQAVLGVILKDPSLSDYIMLQGYALFTALTKYVDEFPTKKEFAVLNQGLDMMLGTNCGLFMYGATGETSRCDQFGGYPVLNMPIPDFMWPLSTHFACQKGKKTMLFNKQKASVRRKREVSIATGSSFMSESASVATEEMDTLQRKIRRRRSLVVGAK